MGRELTPAQAGRSFTRAAARRETPERASGVRVTANAFGVVGERPIKGRGFLDAEDRKGAEPVALLGYGLWKTRYGSDPNVIGRSIRINEVPTTIIGVMAEGMKFPNNADLWIPLVPDTEMERRDVRNMNLFGRLAPGVRLKQAQIELTSVAPQQSGRCMSVTIAS